MDIIRSPFIYCLILLVFAFITETNAEGLKKYFEDKKVSITQHIEDEQDNWLSKCEKISNAPSEFDHSDKRVPLQMDLCLKYLGPIPKN
jgi:hypothetical protein